MVFLLLVVEDDRERVEIFSILAVYQLWKYFIFRTGA